MVKIHVVFIGQSPGLYMDWLKCKTKVSKFACAVYYKFDDIDKVVDAYTVFNDEKLAF